MEVAAKGYDAFVFGSLMTRHNRIEAYLAGLELHVGGRMLLRRGMLSWSEIIAELDRDLEDFDLWVLNTEKTPDELPFTDAEVKVLLALSSNPQQDKQIATKASLGSAPSARNIICKLINERNVPIKSRPRVGYYIDPDDPKMISILSRVRSRGA